MRHFTDDQTSLFFDPQAEPIAEVSNGERFTVDTRDSVCGIAKAEAPRGFHIDDIVERLGGACPVTGPFFVQGAAPGAVLEVEFHSVAPRPTEGTAWTGVFHGFGALADTEAMLQEPLDAETVTVLYDGRRALLPRGDRPDVEIELHPFLGTVGVAPCRERRATFSQSPEYLGDVDQPAVGSGARLLLPVNVEGALIGFGDAHAAQGDGEITGAAIEIEARVELTVRVHDSDDAGYVGLPQLNTDTTIGSIAGYQGTPLGECARIAYADLVRRLVRYHGFRQNDAYMLLGQAGRLHIGNMIPPFFSVLATVERRYIS